MGRRNPENHPPILIGDEPLPNDDWAIVVFCSDLNCAHVGHLGRISGVPKARALKTAAELQAVLQCRRCGRHWPRLKAEFVGPRR